MYKSVFVWFVTRSEVVENYLLKFNCLKMQRALLPVDMSNFNQKNIKIITNSALGKLSRKLFSDQKKIFNILIETRSHIEYLLQLFPEV